MLSSPAPVTGTRSPTRRSQRNRVVKVAYTPSRPEKSSKEAPYSIDEEKALKKKVTNAITPQEGMTIVDKNGTLVIDNMTSAAYELLKNGIYEHYVQDQDKSVKVTDTKSKGKKTKENLVVSQSMSVRNKTDGKQLFCINFFNTTNKIDINGSKYLSCLEDVREISAQVLTEKDSIDRMNSKIAEICSAMLKVSLRNNVPKGASRPAITEGALSIPAIKNLPEDDLLLNYRPP